MASVMECSPPGSGGTHYKQIKVSCHCKIHYQIVQPMYLLRNNKGKTKRCRMIDQPNEFLIDTTPLLTSCSCSSPRSAYFYELPPGGKAKVFLFMLTNNFQRHPSTANWERKTSAKSFKTFCHVSWLITLNFSLFNVSLHFKFRERIRAHGGWCQVVSEKMLSWC